MAGQGTGRALPDQAQRTAAALLVCGDQVGVGGVVVAAASAAGQAGPGQAGAAVGDGVLVRLGLVEPVPPGGGQSGLSVRWTAHEASQGTWRPAAAWHAWICCRNCAVSHPYTVVPGREA